MKTSLELDDATAADVERVSSLIREKQSTVLRLAIRAGLPSINQFQAPRPEGYFADAYKDGARAEMEDAIAKTASQKPER